MQHKFNYIKTKIKRYLPLELSGTLFAVIFASFAYHFTGLQAIVALAGTWGENFGFYGFFAARESLAYYKQDRKSFLKIPLRVLRNIFLEFGLPELFDSFLVRPLCMYVFQMVLGNFLLGILAGKLMADLLFYGLASFMHDIRIALFKDETL